MANARTCIKRIVVAVVLITLFSVASTMDYEDEVAQSKHCKEMVKAGAWPAEVCK